MANQDDDHWTTYEANVREAGRILREAGLQQNIDANLANWPPLTDAQLAELSGIIESHRAWKQANDNHD